MIEKIKELEAKGFRVAIIPQMWGSTWFWTAGVYVGNERKAEWVDNKDPSLPKAGFVDYEAAFNAVVAYCDNYKPKQHGKKGKA